MSRQTTCQKVIRRSRRKRRDDPWPIRRSPLPKRRSASARIPIAIRAIGVGVILLATCGLALAADGAAPPAAPSDGGSGTATGTHGRRSTLSYCDAAACLTPAADGVAAPLRTADREAPRLRPSAPHIVRMEERKLGLRLLGGIYATVSLVPARPLLDPIPPDVSATDRVRVGLGCMLRF
jgi:hypothetical protein